MSLNFPAARLFALNERPYLAVALSALVPVKRPGLKTMAVDRQGRIYWDPDLSWTAPEAGWAILHEVQHWLRSHHERAEPFLTAGGCRQCVARQINHCEDAEINDDLEAEGGKLPQHQTRIFPRTLVPPQPNNLLWEQYYQALGPPKEHQHDDPSLLCGSAAHGIPQDYEDPSAPSYGPVEADLIRDQTARDIIAHSKAYGSMAGRLLRWATERVGPPKIAWEQEMTASTHAACRLVAGASDYSYTRPRRRGTFNGVILPAMVRPLPSVVIVLDTSASMSAKVELPLALAEIPGIVRALGQHTVPVICCDTEAAAAQHVTQVAQLQLQGGGGTDMAAGIAAARKLGDVVIVLTDGHTPWGDVKPEGIEIIVGLIGAGAAKRSTVPRYVRSIVHIQTTEDS